MKIEMFLSAKADIFGRHEILLSVQNRIGNKNVRMRAKSEVRVLPDFFSRDKGVDLSRRRMIAPDVREWHFAAQQKLNALLAAITQAEMDAARAEMTGDWLKRVVEAHLHPERVMPSAGEKSFYELAAEYVERSSLGAGYVRQFWVAIRSVFRYEQFVRSTDSNFVFDPEQVDSRTLEDFVDFLQSEHTLAEEHPRLFEQAMREYPACIPHTSRVHHIMQRGENVVCGQIKRLKTMWRWLNETRRVKNNAFLGFKMPTARYGTPFYITVEEREQVAQVRLATEHLRRQRDIFVFQCLVGCRVSDLMRLTQANIRDGVLEYTPRKTKDDGDAPMVAHVPLLPQALELIGRYKDADTKGRLFPFISAQRYNDAIKDVLRLAGVTREVEVRDSVTGEIVLRPICDVASSHLARRTFVGNLYQQVQDPNLIGRMSGHVEGSKAFARYRKIENDTLRRVIEKIK